MAAQATLRRLLTRGVSRGPRHPAVPRPSPFTRFRPPPAGRRGPVDKKAYRYSGAVPEQNSLESGLQQQKVHVTLDPDTAHPALILSEDHRRVALGEKEQDLPDNPERFCDYPFVLGQEGFTRGRHFWEAHVGNEEGWYVGVARKSVERKDLDHFGPKAGIWEVGKYWSEYSFSSSKYVKLCLTLREEPKRVRVTLNYEGGRVAFYNADSAALIFECPPASFSGDTLLPLFYVTEKAQLDLCP